MSFFAYSANTLSPNNPNRSGFQHMTADRRSPTTSPRSSPRSSPRHQRNSGGGGGGFFSRSSEDTRSKSHHQTEPKSFQEQAMMYGIDLKAKRDQDAKEREAIEKKMAKQSGKKYKSSRSKTDDAKSVFKFANFLRKNK